VIRKVLLLRRPRPDEAATLTELCLRSKAIWGYNAEFIEACRNELTLTPELVRDSQIQIAEEDGAVVGIAQITVDADVAVLDKLFVEPTRLRSSAGRRLFEWATDAARDLGAGIMQIESDPGAAEFYRRMGAVDDGVARSGSIPGRVIPRLKLAL
jgi:GNAT superfamily N-acetyltransferase